MVVDQAVAEAVVEAVVIRFITMLIQMTMVTLYIMLTETQIRSIRCKQV